MKSKAIERITDEASELMIFKSLTPDQALEIAIQKDMDRIANTMEAMTDIRSGRVSVSEEINIYRLNIEKIRLNIYKELNACL